MTSTIAFAILGALFLIGGISVAVDEYRFKKLFAPGRSKEIGFETSVYRLLLNPFWIFIYSVVYVVVGITWVLMTLFFILSLGRIRREKMLPDVGVTYLSITMDKLTREELFTAIAAYKLTPEQLARAMDTNRRVVEARELGDNDD